MPAESIKMISSMATREVLSELAQQYTRSTAQPVQLESAGGVDVSRRVQDDEIVDVVVLAGAAIEQLIAAGKLRAGSRMDLVKSGIAMAGPAGGARPDVGSEEAVRQAVLAARTIGYSTGPSGTYLLGLFERWGIAERVAARTVQAPPGVAVASLVARGEVELGFQQLSELLHVPGITVLGALPPAIQSITVFAGAVSVTCSRVDAARALLDFLAGPVGAAVKRRHGMEPA